MESASTPATGGRLVVLPPLAALFERELELDALERMLLEVAVHPEAVGCARAWLLLFDARRGLLEGWRSAVSGAAGDLAQALGRARRTAPGDDEKRARAWAEPPDALEGHLAQAWLGSTLACGPDGTQGATPWGGHERIGALALRRGPRAYGMIVTAWAANAALDAAMPARLGWLRELADAALGAQLAGDRARRLARQGEALAEMARAGVSAINVAEVLHLLARLAVQATGLRGSAVYRAQPDGAPRVEIAFGPAVLRDAFAGGFATVAREACTSGLARIADDAADAPGLPPGVAGETSVWAALPLAAHGRVHGALVAYDGPERHPGEPGFDRGDAAFLSTLADQAALVLELAEGGDALRRGEQRRAEQAARLHELDRMASVGELAERVARESRNPIASISAFARRAQRELDEGDPQREYLEIVVREAERLDAMLQEQLRYAQLERPRLRVQSLNAVVQESLAQASETLVRRRVRLLKKLASDLPELLLDEHRIRRVVDNVVAFALESVPTGGRIKVESRRAGEWVSVEIAHDGSRAAGEMLEQLFVPFAAGLHAGAAIGLGVAQQIVREHGGEVRVRSEGEWATIFSFTLPVRGNEDRRASSERRSVRGDRRRRGGGEPGAEPDAV